MKAIHPTPELGGTGNAIFKWDEQVTDFKQTGCWVKFYKVMQAAIGEQIAGKAMLWKKGMLGAELGWANGDGGEVKFLERFALGSEAFELAE